MTDKHSRDLLLASTNAGKVRELTQLLSDVPVNMRSFADFPHMPVAEESGETFEANAAIKAAFYGRLSEMLTLADDSGLEVAALGGAPGVRSARYAGVGATDGERVVRLLEDLKRSETHDRCARFVCVVALYDPTIEGLEFFRGVCAGQIAAEPHGSGGFGYDPIFIPDGYDASFAELPLQIKQRISHRAHALSETRYHLLRRFGSASLPDENTR